MKWSFSDFLWDLQTRWPFMFRLKGTVILRIWWQVLIIFLYTVGVVCLHLYVPGLKMDFPITLVNVLGVVIGLLLVFRTNTAYDRYWEGRRIWSTMTHNIRALTRCIWVGVKESGNSKDVIEKRSIINLLIAFAYATKNYLREEYSYDSDGIKELLQHIPKFAETSAAYLRSQNNPDTPNSNRNSVAVNVNVNEGFDNSEEMQEVSLDERESNEPNGNRKGSGGVITLSPNNLDKEGKGLNNFDTTEPIRSKREVSYKDQEFRRASFRRRSSRNLSFTAHDCVTPTNIPIEISYHIAAYITTVSVKGRDMTDPSTMLIMNHALNNLVDCLTGFERILRTPIPLAYSVHLHHCIWLFLLALPYQLVQSLNWWTVPAVIVSSFSLLGILGIGWEIENPFGYDDNDLPLDDFCKVIHKEIMGIVGQKIPSPEVWLSSPLNFPLAPVSMENAPELSAKPVEEIRAKLAQGAIRRMPMSSKMT